MHELSDQDQLADIPYVDPKTHIPLERIGDDLVNAESKMSVA